MRHFLLYGFTFLLALGLAGYFLWWPYFAGLQGAERIELTRDAPFLEPDPALLDAFLAEVVTDDGLVDYAKAQGPVSAMLDAYLAQVAEATPADFSSADARLAFYINAYNALVIRSVLNYWPLQSVDDAGPLRRFFRERKHRVAGRMVSLHGFETKVIGKYDPRFHLALNCAARSCPPLAKTAYRGEILQTQLDQATRLFLNDPRFHRFDEASGQFHLSKIFSWYMDDFGGEKELRRFIQYHRPAAADASWVFSPYDWRLNDARILTREEVKHSF